MMGHKICFIWRNEANYPLITPVLSSSLEHLGGDLRSRQGSADSLSSCRALAKKELFDDIRDIFISSALKLMYVFKKQ